MNKKTFFARKIRLLTQTLILSGFLNLIFLSIFFYFLIRESASPFALDYRPSHAPPTELKAFANVDTLREYYELPFETLIGKLRSKVSMQDGYYERDLALSILVEKYHFSIAKALGKRPLTPRCVKLDESRSITLFPGLKCADFQHILTFVTKERWPFTTKGLFLLLKQKGIFTDLHLVQTFIQTPEFLMVEMLFKETHQPIKRKTILALVCEGKVETLIDYHQKQIEGFERSPERRRELLLNYVAQGSKTAAALLLYTDPLFTAKQLDDETICTLLPLLPENSKRASQFAKELLTSVRGDPVRVAAAQFLKLPQEEIAQIRPPRAAEGNVRPLFRDKPPASPSAKQHVIVPGDSLWLIAKKYNVAMTELMRVNRLSSNAVLQPGKTILIP